MDKQFRTLVVHFFNRFFDRDSPAEEGEVRTRMIQFLACLSLPGLMLSFFLVPDHPPGSFIMAGSISEFQRMWMRSGDRYVFVCYAMCVVGLLMNYKWDSLFPDRTDYLVLTPQPISVRSLFLAKVTSLCALIALVVVAINLFPLVIMPSVYGANAHTSFPYWDALFAQMLGTVGGSIFAALAVGSLQGVLINLLTPDAFRRVSPWIQTLLMTVLIGVLLVIPLAKELIEPLSQRDSSVLNYIPVIWFLGLLESFLPTGTLMWMSYAWGKLAIKATILVAATFFLSYFIGYRRYSRKILESADSVPLNPGWLRSLVTTMLKRTMLRNPFERATFFFIGKIAARSPKHRVLTALYLGGGAALAFSSLFVVDYRSSTSPLQLSGAGVRLAPLILSFVIVAGLRAAFNIPYELGANWMFQLSAGSNSTDCLKAIRKWVFLCRILPLYVVIGAGEFLILPPLMAVSCLIFDLIISFALVEIFFINFNKVPFTCAYPKNKFHLGVIAAAYLYGFTIYLGLFGFMKRVVTNSLPALLVFVIASALVSTLIALLRSIRDKRGQVMYDETEAAILTLSADRGYWTAYSRPSRLARMQNVRPGFTWHDVEQILQDLRFGIRILWKSPGLSATAAILIALVIAGNMTVYSIVHALITKPAPGVTGKNLVTVSIAGQPGNPAIGGFIDYVNMMNHVKTINPLIGFNVERLTLGLTDGNWAFIGSSVTPNYFETLGVQFVRGRPFASDEYSLSSSGLAVVVSFRVWQEQFHGAENVIGHAVLINGHPATVVGVATDKFQGPALGASQDLWLPFLSYVQARGLERTLFDPSSSMGGIDGISAIGRLAGGASISTAQAEFDTLATNLQPSVGGGKVRFAIAPYFAAPWGGIATSSSAFLAMFSILTAITLFIVCATVANLMLSRAMEKHRETTVRLALGAPRSRILTSLLAEGLSVAAVAWLLSCLLCYWTTGALPRLVPTDVRNAFGMRMNHLNLDFTPDWRVLAYAMILVVIATVAFTIGPALRSWRHDLLPALKSGEQSVAGGRSAFSRALVVAQLAFSVVLLTTAGLAYRSLSIMDTSDPGFDAKNVLLVTVNPSLNIADRQTNLLLLERLRERFRRVEGVSSVSYVRLAPPMFAGRQIVQTDAQKNPVNAAVNYVGPDYLHVLGVRLVLGREFSLSDRLTSTMSALVNQQLAETLWPGQPALGQTLLLGPKVRPVNVIGVYPDALIENHRPGRSDAFFVLLAEQQDPAPVVGGGRPDESGEITFYLKYSASLSSVEAGAFRAIQDVDNRIALVYVRTMEQQLDTTRFAFRPLTLLLTVFSATSLLIATIGQYSVIAFDMRRRNREFGVRLAIGASSRQIVGSVIREGFVLTVAGLVTGFALSVGTGKLMEIVLYGVTGTDTVTYAGVFTLLAIASLLACYVPARRASQVDPLETLRCD